MKQKPRKGDQTAVAKARFIVEYAHETAESQLDAFATVRTHRGAKGTPMDEEQDLLRGMLVLAAAGLDSAVKQLIRDALEDLCHADNDVAAEWATFVQRSIRSEIDRTTGKGRVGFLAKAILSNDTRSFALERYISDLTGSSLQSHEELERVCKALGVRARDVGVSEKTLKPIFIARNQIIHELDIDFDNVNRNRFSRTRKQMVEYANVVLEVAEEIVESVARKLGV